MATIYSSIMEGGALDVDNINNKFDDLGIEAELNEELNDQEFCAICGPIIKELAVLEPAMNNQVRKNCAGNPPSVQNIVEYAQNRGCPYASNNRFFIVDYFLSELQTSRMLINSRGNATETNTNMDDVKGICKTLKVDFSSASDPKAILDGDHKADPVALIQAANDRAKGLLKSLPSDYLHVSLFTSISIIILGLCLQQIQSLIDVDKLTAQQLELLEEVNKMFRQDYTLRRQLLLKRIDVTMQSFFWSKSIQVCNVWSKNALLSLNEQASYM